MNEIAELERRITAALERIGQGAEALVGGPRNTGPSIGRNTGLSTGDVGHSALEEAQGALEAERAANARLVARVSEIRDRQEQVVGSLERRVAQMGAQIDAQSVEMARLAAVNADLSDSLSALREASTEARAGAGTGGGKGDGDIHIHIERAREAEVAALRAARRAEMAELQEILSELRPLIGEGAHA